MNPIAVLRRLGLIETLCFKFSNIPYGSSMLKWNGKTP